MKRYSIRKMGTRQGQPHYGAECYHQHGRPVILAINHMSKAGAQSLVRSHFKNVHGIDLKIGGK